MKISTKQQRPSLLVSLALILLPALLLGGCSSTPTNVKSGFLGDYSQLTTAANYDNTRIYQHSDFNLSQIKKIKVVPFEIWLDQTTQLQNLRVNTQQLAQLQQHFYQQLTQGLSQYYELVDEADSETLIIRGAFSRLKLSEPSLSVSDFVPVRIVLNAGNSAYLVATSQQDLISEVSIEAEFLLGDDKTRMFALTATKELDVTVSDENQGNFAAVKEVLDLWAVNFIKKIAEINTKK